MSVLSRKKHGRHVVYPLHSSIQERCRALGFDNLTPIIWHKIANARLEVENGSGFLGKPYEPNAVVKNDMEFILFQRKPGGYRQPGAAARLLSVIPQDRHKKWYQQIWTMPGASTRNHPAPFPSDLAERLVRMFSFVGDTVLDPFTGTGTTNLAARAWGRNSVGVEGVRELLRDRQDAAAVPAAEAGPDRIGAMLGRYRQFRAPSPVRGVSLSCSVVGDLLSRCPVIRSQAAAGDLVFSFNFNLLQGTSAWNVDRQAVSDGEMRQAPTSTVRIAIEHKAVMTEHRKAVKNRKRDFEAHHEHVHRYSSSAIAGGILIVNGSSTFKSPLREGTTKHRDPKALVEHCIDQMRAVSQRPDTGYGLEAKAVVAALSRS